MIQSLEVENFRCLKQAKIEFAALTALVGANGCGKTTVIQALDPRTPFDWNLCWRRKRDLTVRWVVYGEQRTSYSRALTPRIGGEQQGKAQNVQVLRLDLAHLRQPNTVRAERVLSETGDNLTNVFATLTRQQQVAVARDLAALVPSISDVDAGPHESVGPGNAILRFQDRWDHDVWYAPGEVSDGTVLVLAYLVLQHQNPPVDVIAIEEPERGLHPYLLAQLIDLLRGISEGRIGPRPVQIVLATHSPLLLNVLKPEEVRFLTRDGADGSVVVRAPPVESPQWEQAFREYEEQLGSIWLAGGIGGVPGT
jgi:predicted ATPase